jgi:L-threonylcarbamoyladenylate synthase
VGANALDASAVEKIFEAKGRPATSPLIVHVDSIAMARTLVTEWPEQAEVLARRFWPGPLTLVLPKRPHVPDRVTAGLQTIGVRVPAHPMALALVKAAGVPIAAPSANRFTKLSPTTAQHVRQALGDAVAMILDGGPSSVGVESTVLSLASTGALLLRLGMVLQSEIEELIGPVRFAAEAGSGPHISPGQHPKHYSPRTRLVIVDNALLPEEGRGVYLWMERPAPAALSVPMPADPRPFAAALYHRLHEADALGLDWIAVERPPQTPEWAAIRDRLERAAAR